MTRTEFIAETAARLLASGTWQPDGARDEAIAMCDALERCGCAPWQTPPAPALDPLIERAHLFATFCACGEYAAGDMKTRAQAWLADYDAAKSRQTPAPALTDAARRVVEAAVAHHAIFKDSMVSDEGRELANAVRAYKESL